MERALCDIDLVVRFYPGVKYEPTVTLNTDFTDDDLNRFLRGCIEAYCTIPWRNVLCGYGCSDHASWFVSFGRLSRALHLMLLCWQCRCVVAEGSVCVLSAMMRSRFSAMSGLVVLVTVRALLNCFQDRVWISVGIPH